MQVKDLRWALRNTTHNGFPVVRSTQHGEVRGAPANGSIWKSCWQQPCRT